MAQTIGFVIGISDDGWAKVVAEKGQGCGSCTAISQCHGGRASKSETTPALNRAGATVGDRVMLSVASGTILSRMAVLYLVPVLGLLAGAFVGEFLSGGVDGAEGGHSVTFGLAGFVLGFLLSITISRIWSAASPVTPVVTRVVNSRVGNATSHPNAGCGGGG